MKRIKSLLLASLIVISSLVGITTVSAATLGDTTANLYVSDTIEGTPAQTPAEPAVTANIGDIIEVSVTAKAKKDITDICSIDIRTYFNQLSSDSYETYGGNGVLKYTNIFYGDGSFYQTYNFANVSTITNPNMETYPSDRNSFIYTMSSAYNKGDFTSALTLYSFTLEVVESGDAYINTAIRDLAHAYPGQSLKQENDLLDVTTVINVVKQAETHTTEPPAEKFPGDVNGDGEVNIKDSAAIQLQLAKLYADSFDESVADANSDGEINIKDAAYIQLQLAKLL